VSGVSVVLVNKIIEMLESASKLYAHHVGIHLQNINFKVYEQKSFLFFEIYLYVSYKTKLIKKKHSHEVIFYPILMKKNINFLL
jgi:hypothetical protein